MRTYHCAAKTERIARTIIKYLVRQSSKIRLFNKILKQVQDDRKGGFFFSPHLQITYF